MSTATDSSFPPELSAVDREALAWLTRLSGEPADASARREFADWLQQSPEHRQAYERAEALWSSPALAVALEQYAAIPLPVPVRRFTAGWAAGWAAAAGVILTCGWLAFAAGWIDVLRADVATAAGKQRREILADGSALILNTDSAVTLDYTDGRRGVILLKGEAYFEVQPDKARPFVVRAAQGTVSVVGTRFNVRDGATTSVDVESGVVVCSTERGESRTVRAGQHSDISAAGVSEPAASDAEQRFAWLKGRLIFKDKSLADVIAELDRYHPGAIVVADADLGQTRITGNYKLQDTAALVRTLADIAGAKVYGLDGYLTVLKR